MVLSMALLSLLLQLWCHCRHFSREKVFTNRTLTLRCTRRSQLAATAFEEGLSLDRNHTAEASTLYDILNSKNAYPFVTSLLVSFKQNPD
jgi:hypothetical protein